MFELLLSLVGLLLLITLYYQQKHNKHKYNLPHGPIGLPILGNILQLLKDPPGKLATWAKQYGTFYTIYFGTKPVLVVNDVKAMKEVFGTMESTGRFPSDIMNTLYGGYCGVTNTEGNIWLEQYRFLVSAMKQLGFRNSTRLEPVILWNIDDLCAWIDEKMKFGENDDIHFNKILMKQASNTIWNIITGEKIKSTDSKMVQVLENFVHALNKATKGGLAFVSWLKYIAPQKCGYNDYAKACKDLFDLAQVYFEEHKLARKSFRNNTPIDLISAYLDQVENCDDSSSSFYRERGIKNSLYSVIGLFVAGSETTASTLNWLIFYVMLHPDVQEKMQQEIDQNIGAERDPTIKDRQRMPYTDAVILETLRYSSLVPFGIIQTLMNDIQCQGYTLPKGMILLANIYHANRDPEVWGDPETFRPERFLVEDEVLRKALRDSVATFQEGKRKCLGEHFAKDTMFLFTAKLFQKYDFFPKAGIVKEEYLKPVKGYLAIAPDLGVSVKPRMQ